MDSGYDSKVYFADPGTNKIQRASLSGQDIEDVVTQYSSSGHQVGEVKLDTGQSQSQRQGGSQSQSQNQGGGRGGGL